MGPRSPLRFGRCRTDVPPDVLQPIFRKASVVVGQAPMVQGLRSASVVAGQTSPRTSCNPSSARLRLLWGRHPWFKVSAPLRSLQNRRPPGVLRSPLRFGRRRADILRMSCAPSSARLRLLWGRLSIMIRQER